MFPLGGDGMRAKVQAEAAALAFEANRRDLDEVKRGRYLDDLGVRGHIPFGLYVDGFGDAEKGSLCNAAVIPLSVIFFDADRQADPGAEIGRAPRQGLDIAAEQWRGTVLAQDFPDAPWTIRSMSSPGAVDLRARVVAAWPTGSATFAFATIEGAHEAVEAIRKHLARSPQL
jgi:hypothetical protein